MEACNKKGRELLKTIAKKVAEPNIASRTDGLWSGAYNNGWRFYDPEPISMETIRGHLAKIIEKGYLGAKDEDYVPKTVLSSLTILFCFGLPLLLFLVIVIRLDLS
jgi:hypothetical protein